MRIAIPKGRLQGNALRTFSSAGYEVPTDEDLATRRLVFTRGSVEWIFVKDPDVPVYVNQGAADAGIAGLDQILEQNCAAYQPVELPYGRCRLHVIAAAGAPTIARTPRVLIATKYPRIARQYADASRFRAGIVALSGSIELAAVLGLASHVIDLVETGETVRVHGLELQDLVAEITPRLIVSKNAYRTKNQEIRRLIARVEEGKHEVVQRSIA
jgi:ATP phosphoribosyltransferase